MEEQSSPDKIEILTSSESDETASFSKLRKIIEGFKRFSRNSERAFHTAFRSAFLDIEFKKHQDGFDLEKAIKAAPGPLLEVGGPTEYEYFLTDIKNSGKKMFVSNIEPGRPLYNTDSNNTKLIKYEGKIDLRIDATRLPIKNACLGVLFASCMPRNTHSAIFQEASRVLKQEGLLIAPGLSEKDLQEAESLGLEPMEQIKMTDKMDANKSRYDIVFRKR